MDFKSIISKIESIDGPIVTPKAPELPKSVQLNEDAQMRVLAGTSSILAEAKKKKAEEAKTKGISILNFSKTAQKEDLLNIGVH